ncbi:hypothetical protein U8P76_30610 (plasmid) [Rhizobium johnstonii]|nr:hypothetical protein U8P76_30610 [Rhizobium johnstonii]
MHAPAYAMNLRRGSLSNLQLFAAMGDLAGLSISLREHVDRFADLGVDELSDGLETIKRQHESMAAFEVEHGEGACLQLNHQVVDDLITMKERRFTPAMIANAANSRYLVVP